jgi:hypothetical protein
MKMDVGSLQLKKKNSQLPPKIPFRAKAAKYFGICGLALLSSCNAYSRLPQTVRDEVEQCEKEATKSRMRKLRPCLEQIAKEESTGTFVRGEIIDYFEEMLQDSKESVKEEAMKHLNSIFWNKTTGFSERKRIAEIFGRMARLEEYSNKTSYKDVRLQQDALSRLIRIATDKELGRELKELAIVLLEYPWENDQPFSGDWEGYQKYQHSMSDLEFRERTIKVLERIIKHGYGRMERIALPLLAEFGLDENAGPEMRLRIFGSLEGFWLKHEWKPERTYHPLTHIERDDCNGNDLIESLRAIALAEKSSQLRERFVNFLNAGLEGRECFDNPYTLALLEKIRDDAHTSPLLKEKIDKITAKILDDPRTKIQDDEHKAWTNKAAEPW